MEPESRISEFDLYNRLARLETLVEKLENQVKSRELYVTGFSAWTVKNILSLQQAVTAIETSGASNSNSNKEETPEAINVGAKVAGNSSNSEPEQKQQQQQSDLEPSADMMDSSTVNDDRAAADRIDTVTLASSSTGQMETTFNQQEKELRSGETTENSGGITSPPVTAAEAPPNTTPRVVHGLLGGSSSESSMMDTAKLSIVPNPVLWNELLKGETNKTSQFQEQPRSGRSSGDGTLTICLEEEGEESTRDLEQPASTTSPGKKPDATEIVQSMLRPYKIPGQDGTFKAVFTCSFCGKQYKRMAGLCKHLMTCVQEVYTGYPSWELRRALTEERYRGDLVRATSPMMIEQGQPEKEDPRQAYVGPRTSPTHASQLIHCKICRAAFTTVLECKRHILQDHNRELPIAQELQLHRPYAQEYTKQTRSQSLPFYSQYIPLQNLNSEYLPMEPLRLSRSSAAPSAYHNNGVQPTSSYRTTISTQSRSRSPPASELERRLNQVPLPPISLLKPSLQLVETPDIGAQLVRLDAQSPKYCCIFCKGNGLLAEFHDFASLQAHTAAYHSATIMPASSNEGCGPGRNLTIERCTTTTSLDRNQF